MVSARYSKLPSQSISVLVFQAGHASSILVTRSKRRPWSGQLSPCRSARSKSALGAGDNVGPYFWATDPPSEPQLSNWSCELDAGYTLYSSIPGDSFERSRRSLRWQVLRIPARYGLLLPGLRLIGASKAAVAVGEDVVAFYDKEICKIDVQRAAASAELIVWTSSSRDAMTSRRRQPPSRRRLLDMRCLTQIARREPAALRVPCRCPCRISPRAWREKSPHRTWGPPP